MSHKKSNSIFYFLVIAIVAIIAIFFMYSGKDLGNQTASDLEWSKIASSSPDGSSTQGQKAENGEKTYNHEKPNFSLKYPADLEVSSPVIFEEGGEAIVFQKSNEKKGFQIFILPYSDKTTLSKVIKDAFPKLKVEDIQEVIIGNGIHGLIFWSQDNTIGKTRELWFTHGEYLFQVTTYAEFDSLLAQVFSSIKL